MQPAWSAYKNETEPCPHSYLTVPDLIWGAGAGILTALLEFPFL